MKPKLGIIEKYRAMWEGGKSVEKYNIKIGFKIRMFVVSQLTSQRQKNPKLLNQKDIDQLSNMIMELKQDKSTIPQDQQTCTLEEYQQFLSDFFSKVDYEDRHETVTIQTTSKFRLMASFIDVLSSWGPIDEEMVKCKKYCQYKAVDIFKALKRGEIPKRGGPKEQNNDEKLNNNGIVEEKKLNNKNENNYNHKEKNNNINYNNQENNKNNKNFQNSNNYNHNHYNEQNNDKLKHISHQDNNKNNKINNNNKNQKLKQENKDNNINNQNYNKININKKNQHNHNDRNNNNKNNGIENYNMYNKKIKNSLNLNIEEQNQNRNFNKKLIDAKQNLYFHTQEGIDPRINKKINAEQKNEIINKTVFKDNEYNTYDIQKQNHTKKINQNKQNEFINNVDINNKYNKINFGEKNLKNIPNLQNSQNPQLITNKLRKNNTNINKNKYNNYHPEINQNNNLTENFNKKQNFNYKRKSLVCPTKDGNTKKRTFKGKYKLTTYIPVKYNTVPYFMLIENVRINNDNAKKELKRGKAANVLDLVLDSLDFLSYVQK